MLIASRICAFLAFALALVAGYLFVSSPTEPPPGQAIVITDPERNLGNLPIGSHLISFSITNRSSSQHHIIDVNKT